MAFVTYRGEPQASDIEQICKLLSQQHATHGHLIIVNDLSQAGSLHAEGRRRMAAFLGSVNAEEIFVGVAWPLRSVITMVHRVSEITSGRPRRAHFATSEAETLRLIPEIRDRLRAKQRG